MLCTLRQSVSTAVCMVARSASSTVRIAQAQLGPSQLGVRLAGGSFSLKRSEVVCERFGTDSGEHEAQFWGRVPTGETINCGTKDRVIFALNG